MNIGLTPNYTFIFPFEKDYYHKRARIWLLDDWTYSFYFVLIYLIFIFGGQYFLRNRKAFKLQGQLIAWNMLLAIFSFMGAWRSWPELMHVLRYHGLYHSVCSASNLVEDQVTSFWILMFILSKLPELGDTVFIVLRKQPLNFLHWYHHSTVLIYGFFSYAEGTATSRWFATMNFSVHALMYTYYAFRAARFKVPRFCAMIITSLQIVQMIVGVFINIQAYIYHRSYGSTACQTSLANILTSLIMYWSYFVLFAHLFYKSYFNKSAQKSELKHKSN